MLSSRRAFTLVELLVVIAIIGVLISLLLPAVQKVREAANRTICLNNLKQLSLACHHYASTSSTLPEGSVPGSWGYGTWQTLLLPFIEQETLARLYHGRDTGEIYYSAWNVEHVTSVQLKVATCPSDTPARPGGMTWGGCSYHNYAANWGNTAVTESGTWYADPYGSPVPVSFLGAPFYSGNPQRLTDIMDGTSSTLLLAEVVQGQRHDLRGLTWWAAGSSFETYLRPNDSNPDVVWGDFSWCDPDPPNPPCTTYSGALARTFAARSRHAGGVQVAFCDGSGRFIPNGIDLGVWRALGTAHGGEAVANEF